MESKKLFGLPIILLVILSINQSIALKAPKPPSHFPIFQNLRQISVRVDNLNQHTVYSILKDGQIIQSVRLEDAFGKNLSVVNRPDGFTLRGVGQTIEFRFLENKVDFSLLKVERILQPNQKISDCINLETGHINWYGGPQIFNQYWPIEKLSLKNYSYVAKMEDNVGVAERYWLNSKGSFIYVEEKTPLFLNQNVDDKNTLCLTVKNQLPYNIRRTTLPFVYYIGVGINSKEVHLKAVDRFLKKPKTYPDERMVRHPIWSTWARYKTDINESIVSKFADEILLNRFNNSQLEIDDDWEVCYGALIFRKSKFPNIKNFTDRLRARGFRVTLWVHPFINKGCEPWYSDAKRLGYLVADHKNNTDTVWWNSKPNETAHIDFTKTAAAAWYTQRLRTLQQEAGIDSFKFDAGESSWTPPDPVLNGTIDQHPSAITTAYVTTVSKFGPLVEVRSGQGTQNLPIFVRMLDKDSEWNFNNGLPTLITTLLQLNMVGYPFVLPDMIGGNGYNNRAPSKELFIRWLQANVFMPSLQYSYVPWDYDNETIEISRNFTKLHADYTSVIINQFKLAVKTGQPVNAPIWWIDPEDVVAHQINDEFLLGDQILAAPVLEEGKRNRDIYLPRGVWTDPNHGRINITGPKWLMNYPAPLNVLPYFIRVNLKP